SFSDLRAIDPANMTDGLAPIVLQSIFAGLVDFDFDGKVVPDLAERLEVLDEGKAYRFFLHEGIRFHDGEELLASDVKRSAERALHPTAPNPYSGSFSTLVGQPEFTAGKADHVSG